MLLLAVDCTRDQLEMESPIIAVECAGPPLSDLNGFSDFPGKWVRKIREAIQIRKRGAAALNRDDGAFHLDHVYNPLLKLTSMSLPGDNVNKFRRESSGPVHL